MSSVVQDKSDDKSPQTCGDCGLYYRGDCPHATGLFGEEPACEHFFDRDLVAEPTEEVPF